MDSSRERRLGSCVERQRDVSPPCDENTVASERQQSAGAGAWHHMAVYNRDIGAVEECRLRLERFHCVRRRSDHHLRQSRASEPSTHPVALLNAVPKNCFVLGELQQLSLRAAASDFAPLVARPRRRKFAGRPHHPRERGTRKGSVLYARNYEVQTTVDLTVPPAGLASRRCRACYGSRFPVW